MDEILSYYKSVPPFTRYFMTAVFIASFGMTYSMISPYWLILDFSKVFKKLHFWRLLTTFVFAGKFSQSFLFTMIMMYFTIRRCEEYFKTKYADFMVLVLFNMTAVCFYAFLYGDYMVLHEPFVFSLMYVWCKLEPDQMISLWGFPVKSSNLPWVLIVLSILTAGDPFKDLIGIAAGHTYIFLKMILPQSHRYELLRTPLMF